MKKLNQHGAVDGMLVAALLLMLAFGVFAFTRISTADETVSKVELNQSETTQSVLKDEYTKPADWQTYDNKELGIAFDYPDNWGDLESYELADSKSSSIVFLPQTKKELPVIPPHVKVWYDANRNSPIAQGVSTQDLVVDYENFEAYLVGVDNIELIGAVDLPGVSFDSFDGISSAQFESYGIWIGRDDSSINFSFHNITKEQLSEDEKMLIQSIRVSSISN